jgi:hypothetical protein
MNIHRGKRERKPGQRKALEYRWVGCGALSAHEINLAFDRFTLLTVVVCLTIECKSIGLERVQTTSSNFGRWSPNIIIIISGVNTAVISYEPSSGNFGRGNIVALIGECCLTQQMLI